MDYVMHIMIISAIYAMLSQSLNFFSGNTGLLSLVHAGFYGIGAYSWAILSKHGIPLHLAVVVTLTIVASASLLVSFAIFRTRDDYFVIITLSIQIFIFDLFNNFSSVTNGPLGIRDIPQFPLMSSLPGAAAVAVFSAFIVYLVLWRLSCSAWGQNLRAIRDDEIMMASLGKPVVRIKIITFTIGAVVAGYAGIIFAQYVKFIDPTSFTVSESIVVLCMVVVGGLGNVHGAFWGAVLLIVLPEAIRFAGLPGIADGNARQIIYGTALVMIILLQGAERGGVVPRELKGQGN